MDSQWCPALSRAQAGGGCEMSFHRFRGSHLNAPGVLQLQTLEPSRVLVALVISEHNAWCGEKRGSVLGGRGTAGHNNNTRKARGEMLPCLHPFEGPYMFLAAGLALLTSPKQKKEIGMSSAYRNLLLKTFLVGRKNSGGHLSMQHWKSLTTSPGFAGSIVSCPWLAADPQEARYPDCDLQLRNLW